ncbi:hypothetical protein ABNQ38_31830 [Azospirillum sp. A29]|uniref:hypothetical protein n=1 Tax=Azospirillum sp. A29 TaxID=3160606 RepID=UPI003671944F
MDCVFSADWLPLVTAPTFLEALAKLEDFLATLPAEMIGRNTVWADAIYSALEQLHEMRVERKDYGATQRQFAALPKTFQDVLDQALRPASEPTAAVRQSGMPLFVLEEYHPSGTGRSHGSSAN